MPLHQHLVNAAGYRLGPPTRWLPERDEAWLELYEKVATYVDSVPRMNVRVRLAVSSRCSTRARFDSPRSSAGTPPHLGYVDTLGRDTVPAYRRFLRGELPDLLLTTSRDGTQFGAPMTQRLVEAAAISLGFEQVERFPIPDGRELCGWTCCELAQSSRRNS